MHMTIDGAAVEVTNDADLLPFIEARTQLWVSSLPRDALAATLTERMVMATYVAAKFGALCALIKAFPDQPIDREQLFEAADLFGEVAFLNLGLKSAEVSSVEAEGSEAAAGPEAGAGDAGRSGSVVADDAGQPADGGGGGPAP